jgi:hypothetical protein
MGAGLAGASKEVLRLAARYSGERVAFGRPISDFGLIQQKLAKITAGIYAIESASYRTAGLLAPELASAAHRGIESLPGGIGFATECSIVKVLSSETYEFAASEAVQIFGANGYSSKYDVERHYRDARANRIFEGTNEIHRLLITERLLKRTGSGALPIREAAAAVRADLTRRRRRGSARSATAASGGLAREIEIVEQARRLALLLMAEAMEKLGMRLLDRQVLVGALSDAAIEVYAMTSALARTQKIALRSSASELNPMSSYSLRCDVTSLIVHDGFERVRKAARVALGIILTEIGSSRLGSYAAQLLEAPLVDRESISARLASAVVEIGGYPFSYDAPCN